MNELVDGVDLRELVDRGAVGPPRWKASFQIAARTAAALASGAVQGDLTAAHIVVGTRGAVVIAHPSPGRAGDPASDVYALGFVLFEMLLGEPVPVFPVGETEHAAALDRLTRRITDAGLPNAEWRASLHTTLRRMCAWQPEDRLDAEQVRTLLVAFADQAGGAGIEGLVAHDATERLPGAPDETTAALEPREEAPPDEETHAAIDLETDDEPVVAPRRRARPFVLVAFAMLVALVAFGLRRSPATPPATTVPFAIAALDERVQWIRVTDAAGTRLLDGTPNGSAHVPAGTYVLSAKVVGRPVARLEIAVASGLELECDPRERGRVVCADRRGATHYELVP